MFCSREPWRGLKSFRSDYFHSARPGRGAAPSPPFSDVLCICTAPSLHTTEACANGLMNLTPWAETQGVWWSPLCEGLLRFQEAKDLQAGAPELTGFERRHSKWCGQVLKRSCPLYPNCKVTVKWVNKRQGLKTVPVKGSRIHHHEICLFGRRAILSRLKSAEKEKLRKLRSYPFVRDVYISNGNFPL